MKKIPISTLLCLITTLLNIGLSLWLHNTSAAAGWLSFLVGWCYVAWYEHKKTTIQA